MKKDPLFPPNISLESMEENLMLDDVLEAVAARYMDSKKYEEESRSTKKKHRRKKE